MPASVQRRFRGSTGRVWTAQLYSNPGAGEEAPSSAQWRARTVLRFTSDDIVLELADWPENWLEVSDEELAALARRANPPRL